MARIILHADDVPDWALQEQALPHSYLDHLSEPKHPSPDGKRLISDEEIMFGQQFDAAIKGNRAALKWLLKLIAKDNGEELAASAKRRMVVIDGAREYQPIAPVLTILGCIKVEGEAGVGEGPTIRLEPWFEQALERHCRADKLKPLKTWLRDGGRQQPQVRNRDRCD